MPTSKNALRWILNTANWPYLGGPRNYTGECPRCHAEISAKAKICAKCGEPLPGRKPTLRNDRVFMSIRLAALAAFSLIIAWLISRL